MRGISYTSRMRFVTGFLLAASSAALAQPLPDGRLLLDQVIEASKSVKGFHMNVQTLAERVINGKKDYSIRRDLSIYMMSPNLVRVEEYEDRSSVFKIADSLTIADGANVWLYRQHSKQYWKRPYRPLGISAPGVFTIANPESLTHNLFEAQTLGSDSIKVHGEEIPCYLVEAKYPVVELIEGMKPRFRTRQYLIDMQRHVVLREVETISARYSATSQTGELTQTRSLVVTRCDWDVSLSKDLFVFTPPRGSKERVPATKN